MFAPILFWELKHTCRRRWFANVRRLFTLIVLLFFLWYVFDTETLFANYSPEFRFRRFLWLTPEYSGYLISAFGLAVFLLTPILAVTGVMQAMNSKILDLLLTSHQHSLEIVGSYWLATVAKFLLITLPVTPLLFWMASLLGTPWWVIGTRIVCIASLSLPIAAWSVMVTLRLRRNVPALVAAYFGGVALLPSLFLFFTDAQIGYMRHAQYDFVFWRNFVLFVTVPTALFLFTATVRLRAWLEGARLPARPLAESAQRPPVGDDPIFWKQFHIHDFSMIGGLRRLHLWARITVFVVVSCVACSAPPSVADLSPQFEMIVLLIAFPVGALAAAASTASVEREARTWDPLRVTLLDAEEYTSQTLRAVLQHMRTYWLATLPAVLILSCKGRAIGVLAPVVWLIAGSLMRPAAVIGLCYSITANSAAASILTALMVFLGAVVGAGVLLLMPGFVILEALDLNYQCAPHVVIGTKQGQILATLLHLLSTWLLLRAWFAWFNRRLLPAAIAFLTQSEKLFPATSQTIP